MTLQLIVCAAIRNSEGSIICGPRHFDVIMRAQIEASTGDWTRADQGFVDQRGTFLTREQAYVIATEAGPVSVRVGKKAAGRLLDGREWNEFPEVAR